MNVRESKQKAQYSAPKLVIYGDVIKFTSSGTGSKQENTGNDDGNNAKRRP